MKRYSLFIVMLLGVLLVSATASAASHTIMPWYGNRAAAVSLTFDDGYPSQYDFVLPALNQRGFKGTFYICTDYADYLGSWGWWDETARAGHEIGSHTRTHPFLTSLPLSEAEYELTISKSLIEEKVPGHRVTTFSYPYGAYNSAVKNLAQKYYIAARGVGKALNGTATDMYAELSYDVAGYTVAQMKSLTEQAVSQRKWLIPCLHGFGPGEYGGWSSAQFLEYLDYLKGRSDLWVAPFATVIKYMRERGTATLAVVAETGEAATLNLTDTLDNGLFNLPLTLRSEVPASWGDVKVQQGGVITTVATSLEGTTRVVYYDAVPDGGVITLSKVIVAQVPLAVDDSYSIVQDSVLERSAPGVLGNDSGPEGGTLSAELVTGPLHGTLLLNSDGSFNYVPDANYAGNDSFTYRVTDGLNPSPAARVSITVAAKPVFTDDFARPTEPSDPLSPWTGQLGTWTVSNGELLGLGSVTAYMGSAFVAPAPLWRDYTLTGRIRFPAGAYGGGLGGRVDPLTGAHYGVWLFPDGSPEGSNMLGLIKFTGWTSWTASAMQSVNLPSVGTGWHELKLSFSGNRIQVFYDGVLKIDVTDNSFGSIPAYLEGGVSAELATLPGYAGSYGMALDEVVVTKLP